VQQHDWRAGAPDTEAQADFVGDLCRSTSNPSNITLILPPVIDPASGSVNRVAGFNPGTSQDSCL